MKNEKEAARVAAKADASDSPTAAKATGNPHMQRWTALARPPASALKTIKGGRLQGMTDVNPQWRYQAMTEQFGMCGVGWKYAIDRLWTEPGTDGEVLAFAQVSVCLWVKERDHWSDPIVGIGGNHLITKEKSGLRNNDECFKMAVTDALSVALKMLGVAADIYAGLWDGSRYVAGDTEAQDDGYAEWLADLEAVADEGSARLLETVKKSDEGLRDRLRADVKAWHALKTRAEKADKAVAA